MPVNLFATAWRAADGAPAWPTGFQDVYMTTVRQIVPDPPDGVILVGGSDAFGQAYQAIVKRLLVTNGALDPAFGNGGNFTVRLRGPVSENQAAPLILDMPNGTKVAPMSIIDPGDPPSDPEGKTRFFAWLDFL